MSTIMPKTPRKEPTKRLSTSLYFFGFIVLFFVMRESSSKSFMSADVTFLKHVYVRQAPESASGESNNKIWQSEQNSLGCKGGVCIGNIDLKINNVSYIYDVVLKISRYADNEAYLTFNLKPTENKCSFRCYGPGLNSFSSVIQLRKNLIIKIPIKGFEMSDQTKDIGTSLVYKTTPYPMVYVELSIEIE